jgi:hypothetical protein
MEKIGLVAAVVALLCGTACAQNVALNKPVTIVAGAGSLIAPVPSPSVVNLPMLWYGGQIDETTALSDGSIESSFQTLGLLYELDVRTPPGTP